MYTNASQIDSGLDGGSSRYTLTKAPGMAVVHGRNKGLPSSENDNIKLVLKNIWLDNWTPLPPLVNIKQWNPFLVLIN